VRRITVPFTEKGANPVGDAIPFAYGSVEKGSIPVGDAIPRVNTIPLSNRSNFTRPAKR